MLITPVRSMIFVLLFAWGMLAHGAENAFEALKIKRAETFAFAQKPALHRHGDQVSIAFAVQAACDVTVAIENEQGRIVRHLACGVLGPNAPAPFQKDSLHQTIAWDGKDDFGKYVDDTGKHAVRVSLGLKARFERTLDWSPAKRVCHSKGAAPARIFAAQEGVYVFDHGESTQLRFFDRAGNYVRTLYPFPAATLETVEGLVWREFPQDGRRCALKWGLEQGTLLTSGNLNYGGTWPNPHGGSPGSALAVHGGQAFLFGQRMNRIAAGHSGASKLSGPEVFVEVNVPGIHEWKGGIVKVAPRDAAVSPDGTWIYLAGYCWQRSWRVGTLPGVGRVRADGSGKLETFAGKLADSDRGKEDGRFEACPSVAVDAHGRVYAADFLNHRIQVFDASGKHLKNVPAKYPALVRVHPKSGELYVFSWSIPCQWNGKKVDPCLIKLRSADDPKELASWKISADSPLQDDPACMADVDFHTDPPTVWLSECAREAPWKPSDWNRAGIRMLREKDGKLEEVRNFAKDAVASVAQLRPPHHGRQRLFFDPKGEKLYVGEHWQPSPEHSKSFRELIEIDPRSGKERLVPIPFDAEDMAIGLDGLAYLRTENFIARYETATWREVPFDYGDEREAYYNSSVPKKAKVVSGISFAGTKGCMFHLGGMAVSPRGHVVITAENPNTIDTRRDKKTPQETGAIKYRPKMYPGRAYGWEVHVWDRRGKILYEDALPGVGLMSGIAMDEQDALYALVAGQCRYEGKPYFNPVSCTWMKFRPQQLKLLSPKGVIPLEGDLVPKRPPDLVNLCHLGTAWVEGAEWLYGGVGLDGKSADCSCVATSRPALDFFARSFLPEVDRYTIAVVDRAGNTILRIGRYGNVDDGAPLILEGGPPNPQPIGGDEVALMNPRFVETHTDRRLFIADIGNARIASVKLAYHAVERVPLKP